MIDATTARHNYAALRAYETRYRAYTLEGLAYAEADILATIPCVETSDAARADLYRDELAIVRAERRRRHAAKLAHKERRAEARERRMNPGVPRY